MIDNLKCLICGADKIIKLKFDRYRCVACETAFTQLDGSLSKTASEESIESVYLASKKSLFNKGLKDIKKQLVSGPSGSKPTLLDIGCGFGYFLELAKAEGFEAEGIEIYQKAIDHSRNVLGLKVYDKPLNQLSIPDNSYDVITSWGVLDVFPDPVAEVKEMFRVLKPGGVIYMRVNNFDFHWFSTILGETYIFDRLGIKPGILHRWGINPGSFRTILKKASFENIKITNSTPTYGDPYGTGGKFGGFFVQAVKTAYYVFSQTLYYVSFGVITISSALIGSARKPAKLK
jgi:ubiquinone/menaquinone biosynthesis C-methylase UbiE